MGEPLRNFDLKENDLIIADRIYATPTGMAYCLERGADFILRVRRGAFTLLDENGKAMELYSLMSGHEEGELSGFIRKDGALFPVRICYKKKDAESLERTKQRLKRQESKKQITISEEARLLNEYIVLITSLSFGIACQDILELYRFRWQAEIYFKRLKSILDFGELPKKTPESALAWLNGKLMVALLMEKFMSGRIFPLLTNASRSLWRETKICLLLLKTNIVNLSDAEFDFHSIALHFCAEKRRKPRPLQMSRF